MSEYRETPIKVVSYIRESTKRQSNMGYRPEYQKKVIKSYCSRHSFEIVREFEDSGSGTEVKDRPNFSEMISFVKEQGDVKFIVIQEVNRFFRNADESSIFEKNLEEECGIFVVDTVIDFAPRQYLTEGVYAAQWAIRKHARIRAEEESRTISERVKQGYAGKASEHKWRGSLPFGTEWKDAHSKYIGYKDSEAKIVKELFTLYATGQYGAVSLAKHLNKQGYRRTVVEQIEVNSGSGIVYEKKYSEEPFSSDIMRSILANRVYLGYQNWGAFLRLKTINEEGDEIDLEPLLLEEDFNYVRSVILQNKKGTPSKTSKQHRTYLLQGIGFSGVNDSPLHAQTDTSGKTPVRRYIPSTNKSGTDTHIPSILADEAESAIIDLLVHIKINQPAYIEKRLKKIIELEPIKASPNRSKPLRIKKMEKTLKGLKEFLEMAYSVTTEQVIYDLERQISEEYLPQQSKKSAKYYDLLELRNVMSNIHKEFSRLQDLAVKGELVKILFSEISVGQLKYDENSPAETITKGKGTNLLGTRAVPLHKEAKELKALLQKFVPALFEEIYIKNDKEILELTVKPTGLFMLLTDKEDKPVEDGDKPKKNS
jgi:DNA invertase Pin-like site-specific DNA recombinase